MRLLWPLSLQLRDASIVDPFWGTGFVLLAWLMFARSGTGDFRGWRLLRSVGLAFEAIGNRQLASFDHLLS